jgi:tRNA (mo5U34)-methyltransferase
VSSWLMHCSKEFSNIRGFHSIDLGNGIITPGVKKIEHHRLESSRFFDPIDLEESSVIDIGAWNGFYSFEAKRRGAKRVLASDHFAWTDPKFRGRETFDLARSALGLDIEALEIDVPELSVERVGTFDVVLFLGVFYHLFDPIDGLARAAKLAREVLVVETHLDFDLLDFARPAMVFYPGSELNKDATNWWGPNPACVVALLSYFGFAKIDATWVAPVVQYDAHSRGGRAVFHAWRSETRRRSEPPAHLAIQPPRNVDTSLARSLVSAMPPR